MKNESQDLVKGTLDMLILRVLEREPMHGWGIAERIGALSRDVFRLQTGTVYPALQRLLGKGWITAEWRQSESNRRARYYRLTASGRKRLRLERASWERASLAIERILGSAIGIVIGLAGAIALMRGLSSLLFRVDPADPQVLLLAAGVLLTAAIASCALPAARAAHIDPMTVLREE